MNTLKKYLYIIVLILFFFPVKLFSLSVFQNSDFVSLSMKDGLCNNTVRYMMMDSHDYMWICTDMGLCRYNGTFFEIISPYNYVDFYLRKFSKIYEDKDGHFWILSENTLFCYEYVSNKIIKRYSDVLSFHYDNDGGIWISTNKGIISAWDSDDVVYNSPVSYILEIVDNKLFVFNKDKGIFVFDIQKKTFSNIYNGYLFRNEDIPTAYVDKNNILYILSRFNGCYNYNFQKNCIEVIYEQELLSLLEGHATDVCGDGNYLYFSTSYNGLVIYNQISKQIQNVKRQSTMSHSINDNNLSCVLIDNWGGLWLGTYESGINYRSSYTSGFHYYNSIHNQEKGLGTVGNFVEYENFIYVATEGGLSRVNSKTNEAELINIQNVPINTFDVTGLKCMVKADENHIWLAPYMRGLHLYDIKENKIVSSLYNLDVRVVNSMTIDSQRRLWIAGQGGVVCITSDGDNVRYLSDKVNKALSESSESYCTFIYSVNDCLYIATSNSGYFIYNLSTEKIINVNPEKTLWLKDKYVTSIYKDTLGRLWIGTYSKGVICIDKNNNVVYDTNKSDKTISGESVCGIVEDVSGNIWISTTKGLYRINSGGFITNYNNNNGFYLEKPFGGSLYYSTKTNRLWVGGNNGFVYFYPNNIRMNMVKPAVVFENIKVYGNDSLNHKITNAIRNFTVGHYSIDMDYDNFPLDISFCGINYTYPENNQYAYRIDEVNDEWQYIGNKGRITIPSLSPGKYTLQVKAANNDGIWNEDFSELKIRVYPPLWLSWWAYIIYFTVFITLVIYFVREYKIRLALKHENEIQAIEIANEKKNFDEKLEFYTIFSHELRTPLTLIMDPIRELLSQVSPSSSQYSLLQIMKKHSSRLLYIVNQLLDFRKIEEGHLRAEKQSNNFLSTVKEIMDSFSERAKLKNINLQFESSEKDLFFSFDRKLIETLIYNLLFNAVKNTPEGGSIKLIISKGKVNDSSDLRIKNGISSKEYLSFSVVDSGNGIPNEYMEHIFNPFFQASSEVNNKIVGTGIGLYICSNIMKLHEGILYAENNKVSHGASFTCLFPFVYSVPVINEADKTSDYIIESPEKDNFFTEEIKVKTVNKTSVSDEIVLVVEDNIEIQDYLKTYLGNYYIVLSCSNGKEALEVLSDNDVSVVVSDIMMPVMNGIELCSSIKQDLRLSHIPVILLTALSEETNIVEGLNNNADAYITKPFNSSVLLATITNLLRKKETMQKYFQANVVLGVNKDTSTLDEKFINDVYSYIDENMDKPLNLDDMAEAIGISKVHLNRKIKALTSMTPAKLIQKHRFIKAKVLIEKGETSVTEIAYACGFTDPIYFSKCFKQEFGFTPTDYMKTYRK